MEDKAVNHGVLVLQFDLTVRALGIMPDRSDSLLTFQRPDRFSKTCDFRAQRGD